MVSRSSSTSGTRRVDLVTNPRRGLDCDYDKQNIAVAI